MIDNRDLRLIPPELITKLPSEWQSRFNNLDEHRQRIVELAKEKECLPALERQKNSHSLFERLRGVVGCPQKHELKYPVRFFASLDSYLNPGRCQDETWATAKNDEQRLGELDQNLSWLQGQVVNLDSGNRQQRKIYATEISKYQDEATRIKTRKLKAIVEESNREKGIVDICSRATRVLNAGYEPGDIPTERYYLGTVEQEILGVCYKKVIPAEVMKKYQRARMDRFFDFIAITSTHEEDFTVCSENAQSNSSINNALMLGILRTDRREIIPLVHSFYPRSNDSLIIAFRESQDSWRRVLNDSLVFTIDRWNLADILK